MSGPKIIGKIELPEIKTTDDTIYKCFYCGKSTGNLYKEYSVIAHDECLTKSENEYWQEQADKLNLIKDQSL